MNLDHQRAAASRPRDSRPYTPEPAPAQRWNHDHAVTETITRVGVLTGIERTELLRAWDHNSQLVYSSRSNSSREAEARTDGPGRARPTVNKGAGRMASRQAA